MSIICTRCGSTDVACEAMVNPNGMVFKRFTEDAFRYGQCENCGSFIELTDPDDVIRDIEQHYQDYKNTSEKEPDYAEGRIVFKDDGESYDVRIAMKEYREEDDDSIDDKIFYYCDCLSDLKSLTRYGKGDFILVECYRFDNWTEE